MFFPSSVTIVIVFKGESSTFLRRLLEELLTYNNNGFISEIILVNSSSINLEHYLGQYSSTIRVINAPDAGVGTARNLGCAEARNALVLFLDSDCSIRPAFFDGIKSAIKKIMEDNSIGCVGGPVECVPTSLVLQKYLDYTPFSPFPRYEREYVADWKTLHKRHHPNTCNLVLRKDVWENVGGFWKGYGEDVSLLLKITRIGYKVGYLPSLKVYHHHPDNLRKLVRTYFRNGSSAMRILLTFPSSPLVIFRLSFYLITATILLYAVLVAPHFLLFFPALSTTFYVIKTKDSKAALLYTFLDYLLQAVYVGGGLYEFIRSAFNSLCGRSLHAIFKANFSRLQRRHR